MKAQQNKNIIRKVATALGGISQTNYSQITQNSKFYACASRWSILFYSLPEFAHFETFCVGSSQIKMIRLSSNPSTLSLCAVLFYSEILQLYDFTDHSVHSESKIGDETNKKVRWIEFNNDSSQILIFYRTNTTLSVYDIKTKSLSEINFRIPLVNFFIFNPEINEIGLLAGKNSNLYRIDLKKQEILGYRDNSLIHLLRFDPLNSMNCLAIMNQPVWKIFTFIPDFNVISECTRNDIQCHSGDWVISQPGIIITGDFHQGVIYKWLVASGEIIETIPLQHFMGILTITSITNNDFVITFNDGSFGIFNIQTKTMPKLIKCSHTNTIFSMTFLPTDSSILTTLSSDGKIIFWNSPSLTVRDQYISRKKDQDFQFLSASFSPGGGYIAAGTSKGELVIYSLQDRGITLSKKLHSGIVLGVSWSPHNPQIVVTAGDDSKSHFFDVKSLSITATISSHSIFKRIQWSKTRESIAMACEDGSLYVRHEQGAYQIIQTGSTASLFDIDWNLNDGNKVAAIDDVGNVIVFTLDTNSGFVSHGHEGKGCSIKWSPLIDYLLFSGGIDGCLIIWDTRNMSKILSFQAHSTHIYSIAVHPDCPNTIATASRDETIRLWSIDRLLPEFKIKSVFEKQFEIQQFCNYEGGDQIIKLSHRILKDNLKYSFDENDMCHMNDIVKLSKQRLKQLSIPRDQEMLLRAKNAQKNAYEAIDLYMKTGNIKQACELLFLLGEYDKALSFAPAVSYNFWQNMMILRSNMLTGMNKAIYSIIAGDPKKGCETLINDELYTYAELTAASLHNFNPKSKIIRIKSKEKTAKNNEFINFDFDDFKSYRVASCKSLKYAKEGKPLLAAALLTVGDVVGASWRLLHCGELCWAMELSSLFNEIENSYYKKIVEEFIKYSIDNKCIDLIIDNNLIDQSLIKKFACLIKFDSIDEQNSCYKRLNMRSVSQFKASAIRMKGNSKLQFYMFCNMQEEAEKLAVTMIRSMMALPVFDFYAVKQILSIVQMGSNDASDEIAALSHFFGVYEAMWRGYYQIISRMIKSIEELEISWINDHLNQLYICYALSLTQNNCNIDEIVEMIPETAALIGIKNLDTGQVFNGGSTVRSHGSGVVPNDLGSVVQYSLCSGKKIMGNVFYFEDGESTVSQDEALMWYEVSPFSPLKTHKRFSPF